jgi:uncharacterized membrane protein
MSTLRKYLIAGLLVWLPLAATVLTVSLVVDILDQTLLLLPREYRPDVILGFSIPGFGVVLAVTILLLTGLLVANLLGRRLVTFWEAVLSRIPLVRSIYISVKQISTTLLDSDGKSFRKVVLVEYPRRATWSMGFLTNEQIELSRDILEQEVAAVFVPTTPNPTSGFLVLIPKEDIIELDLSIEEGFKYIISMGVLVPQRAMEKITTVNKVAQTTAGS